MIKGGEHDLCCLRRCIVSVSLSCECDAALHDTDDTWAVHKNPPHMYVDDFYGSFIDRYFFDNDIFMYSLLCIICHKLLFYDIFSLIYLSKPHRKYQEFLKKHLMNFLKRLTGLKNFLKDLGYILDCFLPVSQYMPLNLHMIDTNAIIDKAIKRYFVQPV